MRYELERSSVWRVNGVSLSASHACSTARSLTEQPPIPFHSLLHTQMVRRFYRIPPRQKADFLTQFEALLQTFE